MSERLKTFTDTIIQLPGYIHVVDFLSTPLFRCPLHCSLHLYACIRSIRTDQYYRMVCLPTPRAPLSRLQSYQTDTQLWRCIYISVIELTVMVFDLQERGPSSVCMYVMCTVYDTCVTDKPYPKWKGG